MKKNIIILIALFSFIRGYSSDNNIPEQERFNARPVVYGFEENKGQFVDFDKPASHILFRLQEQGFHVCVTTGGISYLFMDAVREEQETKSKADDNEMGLSDGKQAFRFWRMDMNLLGADIRKENIEMKDDAGQGVVNYFLAHCPEGVMNVHTYKTVVIKEVYPGIDWVLHCNKETGLKYDFVIHAGANPSDIQIEYNGAKEVTSQQNGQQLLIKTPMGNIVEGSVLTYKSNVDETIPTFYKIEGKRVSFVVGEYNKNETIVIDPPLQLIWSTYYGGPDGGDGPDATRVDQYGNLYVAGHTFVTSSYLDFPIYDPGGGAYYQDTGIIQTKWYNTLDAFILKFTNAGVRLWATFYGGTGSDLIEEIATDAGNNVYFTGITCSADFPLDSMPGAYYQDTLINSGYCLALCANAFILKFNSNCVRQWATYYGGKESDAGYGIITDASDNLYVTGGTGSPDFPTLNMPGAYYQGSKKSSFDAFILKFNNAGILQWSTYYGDTSMDIAHNIDMDAAGNIYIVGETSSPTFPVYNMAGAYNQSTPGGGKDLFILKFNPAGVRQWSTYYGGSAEEGNGSGNLDIDNFGNLYITGRTTSPNFPTQNKTGAYNSGTLSGFPTTTWSDAFLLKFNSSGVRQWSTYYGGNDIDQGMSIACDATGNVYVTGLTVSTNLPTYNPGASFYFDGTKYGPAGMGTDAFILGFDTAGACFWGTYFGGNDDDGGEQCAVDPFGCLFVTGEFSSMNIDTVNPGGGAYYQPFNGFDSTGYGIDGVILKLCPLCITNPTVIASADTTICAGDSVILTASGAFVYTWAPITGLSKNTGDSVLAKPTITTVYTVFGTDSLGCTATEDVIVTVKPSPAANAGADITLCYGEDTVLTASGGGTYLWNTNETTAAITVNPIIATTYTITVTGANGCVASDEVVVNVNPQLALPDADNMKICRYDVSVTFIINNPNSAYIYEWYDTLTEGTLLGTGTSFTVNNPQLPDTFYVQSKDASGCESDRAAVTVLLGIQPIADFTANDSTPFEKQQVQFLDKSTYADSWNWNFGDGNFSTNKNPKHAYNVEGLYTVTLIVCSSTYPYCCDTIQKTNYIDVKKKAIVLVPSTFTPNGDGDNEVLYVKGEGILEMTLKIYNQWGLLLFETRNRQKGWDGKYKGNEQPEGNYIYILEAKTSDEQNIKQQGVVSIIR